jgi:hypothetical protein
MRKTVPLVCCIFIYLFLAWNQNLILSQTLFPASEKNLQIKDIINEVKIDSLLNTVKELSGEVNVKIGKNTLKIASRHAEQPGNEYALTYIANRLSGYGYEAFIQPKNATCRNVYATLKGTKFPNQKYIICAHYDDISNKNNSTSSVAPGADDNASGTATVLEAARIFSKYRFDYSIVFALFDEEEEGLLGSNYFAQAARSTNDSILGVINIDMIAWDYNQDNLVEIHTRSTLNCLGLSNLAVDLNETMNIGLTTAVRNPGLTSSDHSSFWNNFYSAILIIENYSGDFNSYYHSTNDQVYYFNIPYFEKCAKLSIGTVAQLANKSLLGLNKLNDKVQAFSLYQNYPNPFNPNTVISFQISSETINNPVTNEKLPVQLEIYNLVGQKVRTLLEQKSLTPGSYSVSWDGKDNNGNSLQSGIYFYTLKAGNLRQSRQMTLLK